VELPGFTAAMSGIATVAVGMIFRLGIASMKGAVRHIPSILVLVATFVAVGLLQWPLLPVLLTLAPLSIAAAYLRPPEKAPHE
jgi:chromate transporter